VTNEPTLASDVGLESPTYTNTPAQNSTNDPTVAGENATNESTDTCGNVTSEATRTVDSSDHERAELTAITNSSDAEHLHAVDDTEKASEWIRQEVEKRKTIRADVLRRLNEASRNDAGAIRPVRRARRGRIGAEHSKQTPHDERGVGVLANSDEDQMHTAIGRH
jgi:hypothetical protein